MKMTDSRRLALNIAATYVRSGYTLVLGLVTARWLLLSLGQTDYGLFGLVGGLIAFITFLDQMLSGSISRYYSVAIGAARKDGKSESALAECRRWFTVAVSMHTVVPVVLVAIGWPIGEYAVSNWLVIPPDRVVSCLWVWRLSCLSAFVSMLNVPFRSMYVAKQEIAELTLLTILNATLNALLLYYMVSHPGDWLVKYAFWHCLLAILPRAYIIVRACLLYKECRIVRKYMWHIPSWRELAVFTAANMLGTAGKIVRTRGGQILVNLFYGPVYNAAVTVASRLAGRANTFSASLVSSFSPAIVTAYGSGRMDRMVGLSNRASKLSAVLVMLVSIPLVFEIGEVMRLWLKKPPEGAALLCSCVLISMFLDKISCGSRIAVFATGRVGLFQSLVGAANVLALVLEGVLLYLDCGLLAIGVGVVACQVAVLVIRMHFASLYAGISSFSWIRRVGAPVFCVGLIGSMVALLPRMVMAASPLRVALTTVSVNAVLMPLVWFVVLDGEERCYVKGKLAKLLGRGTKKG